LLFIRHYQRIDAGSKRFSFRSIYEQKSMRTPFLCGPVMSWMLRSAEPQSPLMPGVPATPTPTERLQPLN